MPLEILFQSWKPGKVEISVVKAIEFIKAKRTTLDNMFLYKSNLSYVKCIIGLALSHQTRFHSSLKRIANENGQKYQSVNLKAVIESRSFKMYNPSRKKLFHEYHEIPFDVLLLCECLSRNKIPPPLRNNTNMNRVPRKICVFLDL